MKLPRIIRKRLSESDNKSQMRYSVSVGLTHNILRTHRNIYRLCKQELYKITKGKPTLTAEKKMKRYFLFHFTYNSDHGSVWLSKLGFPSITEVNKAIVKLFPEVPEPTIVNFSEFKTKEDYDNFTTQTPSSGNGGNEER